MIRVHYSYTCDLCGGEIRKAHSVYWFAGVTLPEPARTPRVLNKDACDACHVKATKVLQDAFPLPR